MKPAFYTLFFSLVLYTFPASSQDYLRFLSGTTGAACYSICAYNGYLYAGTGSTLRVYDATGDLPYDMLWEYRYRSAILDMMIHGDYLYVAANYDGITKWSLSTPAIPEVIFHIPCEQGALPFLDVSVTGDTLFLARSKVMSAYKDLGNSYSHIADFGNATGVGKIYGSDIKNGILAYTISDPLSTQNGVFLYKTSDLSFLSHYIQGFCWPENVIWGQNNNLLHVLGGTNTVNGHFYTLDISDLYAPQRIFSDTVSGIPLGFAIADPLNARNINDTIYVATTAGLKPGGPLDTAFIRVYDATDPQNIHLISFIPGGLWHFDLAIHQHKCYVASEWYGIKTVDISNLPNPVDLGNTLTGGWNKGSDKSGNMLAVANEGYGFKLFDISNIYEPALIAGVNAQGFCNKIRFSSDGNYIYTLNLTTEGFRVYDKTSLEKTGSIQPYVGVGRFVVNADRAFIEQEVPGPYLNILDVSDPYAPFIDTAINLEINDMVVNNDKLFVTNIAGIHVFEVGGSDFTLLTSDTLSTGYYAKAITVFHDTVYAYVAQKGLIRYIFHHDPDYDLEEDTIFHLLYGEPTYLASDTFGIYLAYQTGGLYACDRLTLEIKNYFRGELDVKGYSKQYGIQELYCRDNLIFLSEYFSQTSILTNNNNFSQGFFDVPFQEQKKAIVYPNPLNDQAIIKLMINRNSYDWDLLVCDISGKIIQKYYGIAQNQFTFNRGDLPDGIYIYYIMEDNRFLTAGKFILK